MKKAITTILTLMCFQFSFSQTYFQEDWDGNGPGYSVWTTHDFDGLVPDPLYTPTEFNANEGWTLLGDTDKYVTSTSLYSPLGTSNDWIISPQFTIPSSAISPYLLWDAKSESFVRKGGCKIMLSPTGGIDVGDFTVTLTNVPAEDMSEVSHRMVDLTPYIGSTARIAFINNSTNGFLLNVDNIIIKEFTPPQLPGCPTLLAPNTSINNVSITNNFNFSWDAASGTFDKYNFYIGTNPTNLVYIGSTDEVSIGVLPETLYSILEGLMGNTTYYWTVKAYNIAGESNSCEMRSFTTEPNPFSPYCGPIYNRGFTNPITKVNFAGVENISPNFPNSGWDKSHENYTNIIFNVAAGQNYSLTVEGSTSGLEDSYIVYIDWNQNQILNDIGEVYQFTFPVSNGSDGVSASQDISVPLSALVGNTRMRIKKTNSILAQGEWQSSFLNPCFQEFDGTGNYYGQIEDYTINIATLGTKDFDKETVKIWPNPAKDIVKVELIESNNATIEIVTLEGKVIQNIENVKKQENIDVSTLQSGVYFFKITNNGSIFQKKFIKE